MPERAASERIVYLNGLLVPEAQARVSPLDWGLLYGDGLFETVRVYGGAPFALGRHLERLYGSLAVFRIEIPERPAELSAACRGVIDASGMTNGVLRITITRGEAGAEERRATEGVLGLRQTQAATRLVHIRRLNAPSREQYAHGVRATVAREPFSRPMSLRGHKTLNYLDSLVSKQEAHDRSAFEALWRDARGNLVEGATSNVFAVAGGLTLTPPLEDGALPGVTRAICLELLAEIGAVCAERSVPLSSLPSVDELLLTNSVIEVLPVVDVDGTVIGDGAPGPVARSLSAAYRERVAQDDGQMPD